MSERPSGSVPASRASRPAAYARARTAARAPSGAARANARTIVLGESDASSVETIVKALPDPRGLEPGTLVLVPGAVNSPRSLARSVLAVFGRSRTVGRALRCTALVARGYVGVGAAEDDERSDLAWGYAPARSMSEE